MKPTMRFSRRFYIGLFLVLLSFILGGVTKLTFFLFITDPVIRWISVIVYIISWPMLILGGYWVGKEYVSAVKKYFSYTYYHQAAVTQTKKALQKTKAVHQKVKTKVQEKRAKRKAYKQPPV